MCGDNFRSQTERFGAMFGREGDDVAAELADVDCEVLTYHYGVGSGGCGGAEGCDGKGGEEEHGGLRG